MKAQGEKGFTYRALPLTPGTPRVFEAKRHPDGTGGRFECELVAQRPGLVVVRLPIEASYGVVDSYGLFWARRPYDVYHLVPREPGAPIRTRFDVLRDMRLDVTAAGGEVSYLDLYLDLWDRRRANVGGRGGCRGGARWRRAGRYRSRTHCSRSCGARARLRARDPRGALDTA